MHLHWQATPQSAHHWELRQRDSGEAFVLDWFHDPDQRDLTGWYLRGASRPRGPESQRLRVDPAVEIVAADRATPASEWIEWARTVADLTEAIAIARAQDAVFEGAPEQPPHGGVRAAPRRYELVVMGMDAGRLSRAFPALECDESDDTVVLRAVLDEPALRGITWRLTSLGCRLVGVRTVSV